MGIWMLTAHNHNTLYVNWCEFGIWYGLLIEIDARASRLSKDKSKFARVCAPESNHSCMAKLLCAIMAWYDLVFASCQMKQNKKKCYHWAAVAVCETMINCHSGMEPNPVVHYMVGHAKYTPGPYQYQAKRERERERDNTPQRIFISRNPFLMSICHNERAWICPIQQKSI